MFQKYKAFNECSFLNIHDHSLKPKEKNLLFTEARERPDRLDIFKPWEC